MTIAEHLQTQIRTCNRIKWVGGLTVLLVTAHQVYLKHSSAEMYAWMAVVIAPWMAVFIAFSSRIRCPRCQKSLFTELAGSTPTPFTIVRDARREWSGSDPLTLDACPHCRCSFSEPYVGG